MEWVSESRNGTIDYWSLRKFPAEKKRHRERNCLQCLPYGEKSSAEFQCKSKDSSYSLKTKKQHQSSREGGEGDTHTHKKYMHHHTETMQNAKNTSLYQRKISMNNFFCLLMLLILSTGQTALAGWLQFYTYVDIVFHLLLNFWIENYCFPCFWGREDCSLPVSAEVFTVH